MQCGGVGVHLLRLLQKFKSCFPNSSYDQDLHGSSPFVDLRSLLSARLALTPHQVKDYSYFAILDGFAISFFGQQLEIVGM